MSLGKLLTFETIREKRGRNQMTQRFLVMLSVLMIGLLALVACGGSQAATPPPTNTPVPQALASEDETASEEPAAEAQETAEEETAASHEEMESEEPAAEAEEMTEAEAPASEETTASSEEAAAEEPAAESEEMAEAEAPASEETAPSSEEAVAEESEEMAEAASEVRTFVIVPEGSKASYIVAEEFFSGALDRLGIEPGLTDTIGSTQEIEGEMQLSLSDPSPLVSNHFTVNLRSLTSDQSRRDNRIREANLESNTYPLAEFTVTSLENVPEAYNEGEEVTFQANGEMTIREMTQPVTFDITTTLEGDTITGVATTRLKMTDFGFDPPNFANMFSVEDDFTVEVAFTFKEQ
jgi:polyisoprenoid-binding protein YceI